MDENIGKYFYKIYKVLNIEFPEAEIFLFGSAVVGDGRKINDI